MEDSLTEFCFLDKRENRKPAAKSKATSKAELVESSGFSQKYENEPIGCVRARAQAFEHCWHYAQQCVEEVKGTCLMLTACFPLLVLMILIPCIRVENVQLQRRILPGTVQ
jgi:hypothetical protein